MKIKANFIILLTAIFGIQVLGSYLLELGALNVNANEIQVRAYNEEQVQEILQRPTINNNETGYFVDEYSRNPFNFLSDVVINFDLEFGDITYCQYGIVDANNNVVCSDFCMREEKVNKKFYIRNEGEYRFFIKNTGTSPICLRKFTFSLTSFSNLISNSESLLADDSATVSDLINSIVLLSETIKAIDTINIPDTVQ